MDIKMLQDAQSDIEKIKTLLKGGMVESLEAAAIFDNGVLENVCHRALVYGGKAYFPNGNNTMIAVSKTGCCVILMEDEYKYNTTRSVERKVNDWIKKLK